ncbi:hypothetical protein WMY93_013181 [Mugilogobius chulae]|uniref:Uncharacterized protein n=1 Tax=Mugilogobius chulae TaxID=88201 RepID=A0AAW0P2Y8_9GOBI
MFRQNQLRHYSLLHGYKMMHLKCIQTGHVVTQETIRKLLQTWDPHGVQLHRRNHLSGCTEVQSGCLLLCRRLLPRASFCYTQAGGYYPGLPFATPRPEATTRAAFCYTQAGGYYPGLPFATPRPAFCYTQAGGYYPGLPFATPRPEATTQGCLLLHPGRRLLPRAAFCYTQACLLLHPGRRLLPRAAFCYTQAGGYDPGLPLLHPGRRLLPRAAFCYTQAGGYYPGVCNIKVIYCLFKEYKVQH